jgi:hypothetical protein
MGTGYRGRVPNMERPLTVGKCDISMKEMQTPQDKHENIKVK